MSDADPLTMAITGGKILIILGVQDKAVAKYGGLGIGRGKGSIFHHS